MEVNQIEAGSFASAGFNRLSASVNVNPSAPLRPETAPAPPVDTAPHANGERQAMTALSREIRQVLATEFRIHIAAGLPAYDISPAPASMGAVVDETIRAGRVLADRSPLAARSNLGVLRQSVERTGEDVRKLVGDDEHVHEAMERIGKGFDHLDSDAIRNQASSAEVVSYSAELKQRSTIRIRTQEGDIVRLDLRRAEELSAQDVSSSDGTSSATSTGVEISSRIRAKIEVKGDLNEAESAAIQNVFAQAEAIAAEFFGGDLAAAFDVAAGFELDAGQIASVKLKFREKLESDFAYTRIGSANLPPVSTAEPVASENPRVAPDEASAATSNPESDVADVAAVPAPDTSPPASDTVAGAPSDSPDTGDSAIDGFVDLLTSFLASVNEGFESVDGSFRYHYSQSFKLELLKVVLRFEAPAESGIAAENAGALIDSLGTGIDSPESAR